MSLERDFEFLHPRREERRPRKPRGGTPITPLQRDLRRQEVRSRALEEEIEGVSSSVKQMPFRDPDNLYFVVEVDAAAGMRKFEDALEFLGFKIRAYLDSDHNSILMSAPESIFDESRFAEIPVNPVKEAIKEVRTLTVTERVGRTFEGESGQLPVIIHAMPNEQRTSQYLSSIREALQRENLAANWELEEGIGMLATQISSEGANRLLSTSNVVFKVESDPLSEIGSSTARRRRRGRTISSSFTSSSTSAPIPTVDIASLPIVCIADSGVTPITRLNGLVVEQERYPDSFPDSDDGHEGHGHGTPIAHLVAFGEAGATPRARVISYKIYSSDNKSVGFKGMVEAVRRYSDRCRIFISSINLQSSARQTWSNLAGFDRLIQEKNVCFVSSAGNIDHDRLAGILSDTAYPGYISSHHVLHPAQNAHVIGVGAISRRANGNTISPANQLSPFTRCGVDFLSMYDVEKPDTVENGGNLLVGTLASDGVGVDSYSKAGEFRSDFAGTSYSAPLVAGSLAQILAKYSQIQNIETLKAILFAFCDPTGNCMGFGPSSLVTTADGAHVVFLAEGNIPLWDRRDPATDLKFYDVIAVDVPRNVRRIDICLVHSDNLHSVVSPSLDTFLTVHASKGGAEHGWVPAKNQQEQSARRYVKKLYWENKTKSMQAHWEFWLLPDVMRKMHPETLRQTTVRYGCVIKLTARNPNLTPLTDEYHAELSRRRVPS